MYGLLGSDIWPRYNYLKIWNLRVQNKKRNKIKKIYNIDPHNVLLAIATNIPMLLMTGFVVQGHKLTYLLMLSQFQSSPVNFPTIVIHQVR